VKYGELIQFEPIESVKVLREADAADVARTDVLTFVISSRMAEQLTEIIFPNLQFDEPADQHGLLVVANYGTGKTHLMSVIGAVAEHAEFAELLTNPNVRNASSAIAGRFRVIRAEIGTTRMSLRDIVCAELTRGLARMGIDFTFPDLGSVTNTKDSLVDMMAAVEAADPGRGLLLVLDELLDYLQGRRDAELFQDLRFLREIGEICRSTRFRFIAGVQETIFDNPRFHGAADAMLRVKDRFQQVRISREDIAFVVQERLLRKTVAQRDRIRAHLQPFTASYEGMAENLDDYVGLFPVHPAYLSTFERITMVEKRKILTTLSQEMRRLHDQDVPADKPGLICYDTYRAQLAADPANRAIPEVREVLDRSEVLRSRVIKVLGSTPNGAVALRIVDGLAVHRLTTEDIYVPIGATARELRDDLCLLPDGLPERDALFLEASIGAVIDDIVRAVSGQFISENPDNGQVWLDVRKDIDYDQKIDERAVSLDDHELDKAYFRALEEVLEQRDAPYVAGFKIWAYELPWHDRNVTRAGYLFMGAPNERSTAQPPRDFYVYFLQPYDTPPFVDEVKPDEVFFRLDRPGEPFTKALRRYAGAVALARESTATHRNVYEDKAREALIAMTAWLRGNMHEAVTVTYRGVAKALGSWLGAGVSARPTIKEQVDLIAATALSDHFAARYPDYPRFQLSITQANLGESVRQALAQVAGRTTVTGTRVLASLELVTSGAELTDAGRFARALLATLDAADGKAVNREELLVEHDPDRPTWGPWHLEPVWLVVVAAALTQLGRCEIGLPGQQIDALGLDRLARLPTSELEQIAHVAPPKALPVTQLREVAKLLRLPPGIVSQQGATEGLVRQFITSAATLVERTVEARSAVLSELKLWGALVFEEADTRARRLEALQRLLELVRNRDTVGKMNKLQLDGDMLADAHDGLAELRFVEEAVRARLHLTDTVEYLERAVDVFGGQDERSQDAAALRQELLALFRSPAPPDPQRVAALRAAGDDLRRRFAEEATRAHERDRLDGTGDDRKRQVLEGDAYRDVKRLAAVSLLPGGRFGALEQRLLGVGTCKTFDERALLTSVVCPECGYRPRAASGPSARATVDGVEADLAALRAEWERTLLDSLAEPEITQQVQLLLDPADRARVTEAVERGLLPSPVDERLVRALNQAFARFDVRRVSARDVWQALFPGPAPATLDDLRTRFQGFLDAVRAGKQEANIRVVPAEEVTTS